MEKIYNANSLIKKNLGTNYNITDNPLFLFYVENLRDSVHDLSTCTPSITQIGSILDFF